MPGFASTDAEQAELEAWEANILAASGVFTGMGLNRQLAGKPASYSPLPLASAYASVTAALAITCALYRREMAGESDPELHIEVPLASALLDALVHNSLQYEAPEIYHSRRQRALSVPRASPLDYFETLELTDPFYSHYTCADARPFYIVAPCHLRHQKNAIKVLGIEEQVRALGVPLAATYGDATHAASRHGLGAGQVGDAWAAPLRRLLRRAFVTKTAYEWEALFGAAGVPGAAHRTTVEWLDSPHVRAAGLVREDAKGQLRPGAVVWVAEEEIPIRKTKSRSACLSVSSEYQKPVHDSTSDPGVHARVPPTTNRTTATICHAQACEPPAPRRAASCHSSTELHGPPCEAAPPQFAAQDTRKEEDRVTCNGKDGSPSAVHEARDHDERCRIGRTGPWLSGVTILDLANVIAGPTIGAMLARYGADVIKIDPPRPTYSPEVTVLYGLAANAGKRSILLDVRPSSDTTNAPVAGLDTPDATGRVAFEALVRAADVVVYNGTSDALARLGLTPAELNAINPNVILSRFDAYGGPNEGKGCRINHLGYDDNLQAALGIMERFGGGLGRVEEHAHVGTIDVAAGVGGALATAAALLLRERRRAGALPSPTNATAIVARASLASVGQVVQYPFCCGFRASLNTESITARTRLGPECEGEHALLHCYPAADGSWLLLSHSLLPLAKLSELQAREALEKLSAADPRLASAVADATRMNGASAFNHKLDGEAQERTAYQAFDVSLAACLRRAFSRTGSARAWVDTLATAGVRAVVLSSFDLLRASGTRAAEACSIDLNSGAPTFQFLRHSEHPMGGDLVMFAPCSVRTPGGDGLVVPLPDAPRYGEHTVPILTELGYNWRLMVKHKQAATRWCTNYLPGAECITQSIALAKVDTEVLFSAIVEGTAQTNDLALLASESPAKVGIPAKQKPQPARTKIPLLISSDPCPICFEKMCRPVGLSCSHQLCSECAAKCSAAGLASCPLCRHPQLLDPAILARRSRAWRQAYSGWRRGLPKGSQGEFGAINTPVAQIARSQRISRMTKDTFVSHIHSIAGDLALSTKTPKAASAINGKASRSDVSYCPHSNKAVGAPSMEDVLQPSFGNEFCPSFRVGRA